MTALEIATKIADMFEGLVLKPYYDCVRVATIGRGTTHYPNGKKVTINDKPITEQQANEYRDYEMNKCLLGALKNCPNLVKYQERWGAIGDFCYNLGVGRLQTSTLKRKINEEEWEEAREQILKWVFAGGKKLKGLVRRRNIEAQYL